MVITYHGQSFLKFAAGDTVVAVNPGDGGRSQKTRFGADICLVSSQDPAYSRVELVTYGSKEPFVCDTPGEYEIKGTYIRGTESNSDGNESKEKKEAYPNTAYAIRMDNITSVVLGAQQTATLSPLATSFLGEVDILFVPIGGGGVLDAPGAYKIATALSPKVVIPVSFEGGGKGDPLSRFLKEFGEDKVSSLEKYSVKYRDIEDKEGEIVILKPA